MKLIPAAQVDGSCWKWLKIGSGGAVLPADGCHTKGGGCLGFTMEVFGRNNAAAIGIHKYSLIPKILVPFSCKIEKVYEIPP